VKKSNYYVRSSGGNATWENLNGSAVDADGYMNEMKTTENYHVINLKIFLKILHV
jgi:hypothetical protein